MAKDYYYPVSPAALSSKEEVALIPLSSQVTMIPSHKQEITPFDENLRANIEILSHTPKDKMQTCLAFANHFSMEDLSLLKELLVEEKRKKERLEKENISLSELNDSSINAHIALTKREKRQALINAHPNTKIFYEQLYSEVKNLFDALRAASTEITALSLQGAPGHVGNGLGYTGDIIAFALPVIGIPIDKALKAGKFFANHIDQHRLIQLARNIVSQAPETFETFSHDLATEITERYTEQITRLKNTSSTSLEHPSRIAAHYVSTCLNLLLTKHYHSNSILNLEETKSKLYEVLSPCNFSKEVTAFINEAFQLAGFKNFTVPLEEGKKWFLKDMFQKPGIKVPSENGYRYFHEPEKIALDAANFGYRIGNYENDVQKRQLIGINPHKPVSTLETLLKRTKSVPKVKYEEKKFDYKARIDLKEDDIIDLGGADGFIIKSAPQKSWLEKIFGQSTNSQKGYTRLD